MLNMSTPVFSDNEVLPVTLFPNVESAWFWFVQAYDALHSGARVRSGCGSTERPCEPVDIYAVVMRLFKNRVLNKQHMRVLAQYGKEMMAPNPRYEVQERDYALWQQALAKLEPFLQQKGIVTGEGA